jgi:hypothetical protein
MNDSGRVVGISGSARNAHGPTGAAVGDQGGLFTRCNTAYHRPAAKPQITGLVQIDDVLPPDIDRRILFPPLARTAGFENLLCAIERRIHNFIPYVTAFQDGDNTHASLISNRPNPSERNYSNQLQAAAQDAR